MGYACPVCGAEQPDGEHLANHVAFTAMLQRDDHEDWLDERVPDWPDRNPDTLAPDITPHAPEVAAELVTDEGASPSSIEHEVSAHGGYGRDALSPEQEAILDEARDLTRQMYGVDEDTEVDPATDENTGDDRAANGDGDTESESE